MTLKPGTKLFSAACMAELIVVAAPSAACAIWVGGEPALRERPAPDGPDAPDRSAEEAATGPLIGKRYVDEVTGLELLCTKSGSGAIVVDGREATLKEAKPLPASD